MMPYDTEPSLDDLLHAAPIRLLMQSDGVEETALRRLMSCIKQAQRRELALDDAASPALPPAVACRPQGDGLRGCSL